MATDADFALNDMKEIIDDFLIETDELINSLDTDLVKLENAPGDLDLLNSIFRAAHTIKGTSSFLGFDQVTNLTHKMEDILNRLRKAEIGVTSEIMDILLESLDVLKLLIQNVREGVTEEIPIDYIVGRLVTGLHSQDGAAPAPENTDEMIVSSQSEEPAFVDDGTSVADESAARSSDAGTEESASDKSPTIRREMTERKIRGGDQTIRVDVDRLDTLMNLMGELVLGRNSLMQLVNKTAIGEEINKEHLHQSAASVNYITTELQLAVMKMRMQPVGKVFSKFPRLVRDLARDTRKEIDLQISGEGTELDKSVIEEIGDPLVHIIRNSCDHGIEPPEDRVRKGKPRRGTVNLSASQEGSNIVIKIEDDGKGLDVDAIRSKAVERRLTSQAEAERLPDREVFAFIWEPGFSTAKKVTGVSGRGVGMDVVRTNIEKLNGMIEIESQKDVGTVMSIKLPLTLAIIQGLLVESDDEIFILPLSSVHETVKTEQTEIYYVNQRPVMRLRDDVIPVININEILRNSSRGFIMSEKPYVVVVGLAEKKLGIMIDRFLGQEEVVIKSLGEYLGSTEGIAGATILGDGRIRLIVDLIGLFAVAKRLN